MVEGHHDNAYQDDDIPRDDDNGQPTREQFENGEGDKSRRKEKLVGNGIQISPQLGPLACQPSDEPVRSICNPRQRKDGRAGLLG